jgi:hypothetical protein
VDLKVHHQVQVLKVQVPHVVRLVAVQKVHHVVHLVVVQEAQVQEAQVLEVAVAVAVVKVTSDLKRILNHLKILWITY